MRGGKCPLGPRLNRTRSLFKQDYARTNKSTHLINARLMHALYSFIELPNNALLCVTLDGDDKKLVSRGNKEEIGNLSLFSPLSLPKDPSLAWDERGGEGANERRAISSGWRLYGSTRPFRACSLHHLFPPEGGIRTREFQISMQHHSQQPACFPDGLGMRDLRHCDLPSAPLFPNQRWEQSARNFPPWPIAWMEMGRKGERSHLYLLPFLWPLLL